MLSYGVSTVRLHRTGQTHREEIVLFANVVQVTTAEWKGAEIAFDRFQQRLGCLMVERVTLGHLRRQRVVRAGAFLDDTSSSRGAERLDGEVFAFLHFCLVSIRSELLYDGHSFPDFALVPSMNAVRCNRMTVEVADGLDYRSAFIMRHNVTLMCLAANLNFVRLHNLLDRFSDIAHADVDTRFLWSATAFRSRTHPDPGVRGILDSFKQSVPRRLKVHGECGIHNPSVHVHAKIDFHDVVGLQDCRD